jgi:hypothetical protein
MFGGDLADINQFSIVTYERRPGRWRAAITPVRQPAASVPRATVMSMVTPDDHLSELDATSAARKMIMRL